MNIAALENSSIAEMLELQEAGVLCANRDGAVIDANAACAVIFGVSKEALKTRSVWDLSLHFHREKILTALHTENGAHRYFAPSQGGAVYQAYFVPVKTGAGELNGFTAFILPVMGELLGLTGDSSESERLEAIGKVTGKLGHDFNNLLGAIQGCVELIRHKIETQSVDKNSFERHFGILEASLRKANMLTSTMRGFVRPGPLRTSRVSLRSCVDAVIDLMSESQAVPYDITFEAAADPLVEINQMQVVQMILSLCVNALEAMLAVDERHLLINLEKISVDNRRPGGLKEGVYAHLAIIDHGTGMTAETKAKAFKPFFTTKRSGIGKGFGLGLAMALEIMKKHEGDITIESIPNCGTCVHLYFPAAFEG